MKLYRGLRTKEFISFSKQTSESRNVVWEQILKAREKGNFDYPINLNSEIVRLSKTQRTLVQNFTDNAEIAKRYAKENQGILIEIELSIKNILKHFTIEFQNFGKRKTNFELVYTIPNEVLTKYAKKWKLKTTKI